MCLAGARKGRGGQGMLSVIGKRQADSGLRLLSSN